MSKTCTRCGVTKLLDYFIVDRRRSDGRGSWCKDCKAVQVAAWHDEHSDDRNAQARQRYATVERYRVNTAARTRRWKDEHPDLWRELKRDQSKRYRERKRQAVEQSRPWWKCWLDWIARMIAKLARFNKKRAA